MIWCEDNLNVFDRCIRKGCTLGVRGGVAQTLTTKAARPQVLADGA